MFTRREVIQLVQEFVNPERPHNLDVDRLALRADRLGPGFLSEVPLEIPAPLCQHSTIPGETQNESSLTRAALSSKGRAKSEFLQLLLKQDRTQ
jgi:hypothetical protein